MQNLRQLGTSIFFAALFLLLAIGGLSKSLAEDKLKQQDATTTETSLPPASVTSEMTFTATLVTPGLSPTIPISFTPSLTATIPPPTTCPPPASWVPHIVQFNDSLDLLAVRHKTTKEQIKNGNCLLVDSLLAGTRIYLPAIPTLTPIPCGAPYGWVFYTVQSGENLYRISLKYRVSIAQLQQANCLGMSSYITVGQKLYVPNVATSTPIQTNTPTASRTPTATSPSPATATATGGTLVPTNTATNTPTETATTAPPTNTATAPSTSTPVPTTDSNNGG